MNNLVLHQIPIDKEHVDALLILYLSLVKNTYSPDVIAMSLSSARNLCSKVGISGEVCQEMIEIVGDYWEQNRMFRGFF